MTLKTDHLEFLSKNDFNPAIKYCSFCIYMYRVHTVKYCFYYTLFHTLYTFLYSLCYCNLHNMHVFLMEGSCMTEPAIQFEISKAKCLQSILRNKRGQLIICQSALQMTNNACSVMHYRSIMMMKSNERRKYVLLFNYVKLFSFS